VSHRRPPLRRARALSAGTFTATTIATTANYLQDTKAEDCIDTTARKDEGSFVSRPAIEPECKTKRVPLDPRTPNKAVMISQDLSSSEETEMLSFLDKIVIFSHGKPLISLGSSSEEIEAPQNV
jgi:hypothetical protein